MSDIIFVEFDQEKFNREIAVLQEKDIDYIEAVVEWCEINEIEVETVASLIKKMPEQKAKIATEARKKFLLRD